MILKAAADKPFVFRGDVSRILVSLAPSETRIHSK